MRNRRTMSSSSYGGLDTSSPSKMTGRSGGGGGGEEEWLHVSDDTNTNNSSYSNNNHRKKKKQQTNNTTTTMEALEMGHDDNEYSIDSSSDSDNSDNSNDDSINYELSDHTPTLSDHLTGRTTFLHISIRQKCIVCLLSLITIVAIIVVYGFYGDDINLLSSILPSPPGAVGVGHAAYDTVHSSYVVEYDGRLTLYKHRITGAEFLAYVPEHHTTDGLSGGGSGSGGYDPKPDKVFGVAFRTKPESSTGVPHILERKFYVVAVLLCFCNSLF